MLPQSTTHTPTTALITGVTGQDGSYLAEFLLDRGYAVHGVMRRNSTFTTERIDHIFDHEKLFLHYADLTDLASIMGVVNIVENACDSEESIIEVYNLAAQSHVGVSFLMPVYTLNVNAIGALNMLDSIRQARKPGRFRYYQASTSEMFGNASPPQSELTPFQPQSPYACAKMNAHWLTKNYRDAYHLHASNGVLFNHESERRGLTFVTRKTTSAVARIAAALRTGTFFAPLVLGNIEAARDWGYAPDYVRAMWTMLQCQTPGDFVVATGEEHTVREFVEAAFSAVGLHLEWRGKRGQIGEYGVVQTPPPPDQQQKTSADADSGEAAQEDNNNGAAITPSSSSFTTVVKISKECFRPTEVDRLCGDSSRIREMLHWAPTVGFSDLVQRMVAHDVARLSGTISVPHQ